MKYFIFILLSFQACFAETEVANKDKKSLSTQMSFEDLLVQGKYHFADEAVTTVEEDKVLNGLLSVRKDFSDRIEKSKEQY